MIKHCDPIHMTKHRVSLNKWHTTTTKTTKKINKTASTSLRSKNRNIWMGVSKKSSWQLVYVTILFSRNMLESKKKLPRQKIHISSGISNITHRHFSIFNARSLSKLRNNNNTKMWGGHSDPKSRIPFGNYLRNPRHFWSVYGL